MMLSAMPETTWSPRWLTHAYPCSHESRIATPHAHAERDRRANRCRARGGRGEGGEQHLAFEPEVDHARALRQRPASAHRMSRRRHAQRGGDQRAEEDRVHQPCRPFATRG